MRLISRIGGILCTGSDFPPPQRFVPSVEGGGCGDAGMLMPCPSPPPEPP
jgi:hypothetical protein